MEQQQKTAGETASKTLVIFRDCHKKNNIVVRCTSSYDERFVRNFAMRKGWLCASRKDTVQKVETSPSIHDWHKSLSDMPRPKLVGAFNLKLSPLALEGGAA